LLVAGEQKRRQMQQAVRVLQKIGSQTIRQRLKVSQKMPRSFDLEAGEGPGKSKAGKDGLVTETSPQGCQAKESQEAVERQIRPGRYVASKAEVAFGPCCVNDRRRRTEVRWQSHPELESSMARRIPS
jgi:hypothetical protein